MKHLNIRHLLEDVSGTSTGPGRALRRLGGRDREEFAHVAAARLPIVREACESGRYNAIVLLGGGEPGFMESREIARKYGIAVSSCAFSQMHIASMLGNKFSVIDFAESHNMYYHDLVVRHRFADRCASIRCVNYYHARPGHADESTMADEREKALRGEHSEAVERAVAEAVAAIEEDGAEVITFGCSDAFWLQPFLKKRLAEMGWEAPVLEVVRDRAGEALRRPRRRRGRTHVPASPGSAEEGLGGKDRTMPGKKKSQKSSGSGRSRHRALPKKSRGFRRWCRPWPIRSRRSSRKRASRRPRLASARRASTGACTGSGRPST
jgi:Asp/Glu/hydantoin racemase